jgi:hypothetical protein
MLLIRTLLETDGRNLSAPIQGVCAAPIDPLPMAPTAGGEAYDASSFGTQQEPSLTALSSGTPDHHGVSGGSFLLAGQDSVVGRLRVLEVADVIVPNVDLDPFEIPCELIRVTRRIVRCDWRCCVAPDIHRLVG